MKKLTAIVVLALMVCINAFGQEIPASAWGNTPPLHVEGKYLVDPYGNKVVLHGVMDTPSAWFNNGRWGWPNPYSTTWAPKCRAYFDKLFEALTDTTQGAYCNLFRLHLDPCWTNDPNKKSVAKDAHGNEVGGEANISQFSPSRLKTFLRTVYVPIALSAVKHGMYVIMRPPGVFPGYVEVGDYYNDYIMKVWDIVTQNDSIKKYSGQIMIELGNEPVTLRNAKGQDDDRALCDFFQPVVDKMRENGYEGVIWGVGTGWQGNYRPYAKYPLVGKNIGYAVHNYVGWYGGNDRTFSSTDLENYAKEVHNSWPIMDTNPIVITEVDWSPEKAGTGHTNEHGDWVTSNYGTWATGSTSKWGKAFKYMMDKFDNISMTLSGTSCLIDVDEYLKSKKVVAAFSTDMKKNKLDPYEASGAACLKWYKEWAKENYARPDLTKVESEIVEVVSENTTIKKMVGQSVDLGLIAKYADGLTSKVPASLCSLNSTDESIFEMKDGKFVAAKEGSGSITATVTDYAGKEIKNAFDVTVLPPFSLEAEAVNPSITKSGSYVKRTSMLTTGNGGLGGWVFDGGLDLSGYNYLIINLRRGSTSVPVFCLNDVTDPYAVGYELNVGTSTKIKIDLKNIAKKDGSPINLSNICLAGFRSNGSNPIYIKEAFLSLDGETAATVINDIDAAPSVVAEEYYNAAGQRTAVLSKGVNIIRQTLSNGERKAIRVLVK